jgi:pantoate ligase/cytidylate kinase
MIVAIDGPTASGKSTIGRMLARHLGLPLVDTGLMYRAVTLLAREAGVDPDDEAALTELARGARIELNTSPHTKLPWIVRARGRDLSEKIFDPVMAPLLSRVSQVAGVRAELVARQREYGSGAGVVMAGRDIGTVVFPKADLKVFLTASPMERTRRRGRQLDKHDKAVLEGEVAHRDAADSGRAISPLRPASDALTIDTDGRSPRSVFEEILRLIPPSPRVPDSSKD